MIPVDRNDSRSCSQIADWRDLTVTELAERLAGGAIALWPVGATEQHGPHVVTGFDHLTAERVVTDAAARLLPHVVVLPTLALGCSVHWLGLGGTLTLTHECLFHVMKDVCHSLERAGANHVVIVNGHMGNVGTGLAVLSEFVDCQLRVEFVSYWDLIDRELLTEGLRDGAGVGHAGEFETSIGLHIGGLVREDAIPGHAHDRRWAVAEFPSNAVYRAFHAARDTLDGVIGTPSDATAALGGALLGSAVDGLVAHCSPARQETAPG
jgi:creatinine amidohydrolase